MQKEVLHHLRSPLKVLKKVGSLNRAKVSFSKVSKELRLRLLLEEKLRKLRRSPTAKLEALAIDKPCR